MKMRLNNDNRLCIIVVLYNRKPSDAETICSLSHCMAEIKSFSRVIVWDNSATRLSEDEVAELETLLDKADCSYRFNNCNKALSKIYNETIEELSENEYMVIFDHDTTFDLNYFSELTNSINQHPDIFLFLPLIYYKKQIISPATMRYFKGSYWTEPKTGVIDAKDVSAINSGMAISGRCLATFRYDERLKFYQTDNDFMIQYGKTNKYICILPVRLSHVLNSFEDEPFEKKAGRFSEMRSGLLILMRREGLFIYLLTHIYLFLFTIKTAIVNREIRYLFLH